MCVSLVTYFTSFVLLFYYVRACRRQRGSGLQQARGAQMVLSPFGLFLCCLDWLPRVSSIFFCISLHFIFCSVPYLKEHDVSYGRMLYYEALEHGT